MREDSAFLMAHAEVVHKSAQTTAVQKGCLLVVLSNIGSQSAKNTRSVQSWFRTGPEATNVPTCKTQAVKRNGALDVTLEAGQPEVYYFSIRAGDLC